MESPFSSLVMVNAAVLFFAVNLQKCFMSRRNFTLLFVSFNIYPLISLTLSCYSPLFMKPSDLSDASPL